MIPQEIKKCLGSEDPLNILKKWIKKASSHPHIKEGGAMGLSTLDEDKTPLSRIVLAKQITSEGIIFYTNTQSKKGRSLSRNSKCSLNFYWDALFRQVCLKGRAEKIPRKQTLLYWNSRPRESQLSQWISKQSLKVKDRKALLEKKDKARLKFKGKPVPCPENWSGYHVIIYQIEFWIGRYHRLHDRFLFIRNKKNSWSAQRLFP